MTPENLRPFTLRTNWFAVPHAASIYEAAKGAEAVIIATEWEDFRVLDLAKLKEAMNGNVLMDARNLLNADEAKHHGFRYLRVGSSPAT